MDAPPTSDTLLTPPNVAEALGMLALGHVVGWDRWFRTHCERSSTEAMPPRPSGHPGLRVGTESRRRGSFGPTLELLKGRLSGSHESSDLGAIVYVKGSAYAWHCTAVHGTRWIAAAHEREWFDEISATWQSPWLLKGSSITVALRDRQFTPAQTGQQQGRRASISWSSGGQGTSGRIALATATEATLRGGRLGESIAASAFVRSRIELVLAPVTVLRRSFACRLRAYGCWMPWSTPGLLPAADACEHPVGTLRGVESVSLPPGNLATVASSLEVETIGRIRTRLYVAAGAAVPSIGLAHNTVAAMTAGYAFAPLPQRVRSRFMDHLVPVEVECAFPFLARVWNSEVFRKWEADIGPALVEPRCRVIWSNVDVDHRD